MQEHLQALVDAQIEVGVAINSTGSTGWQVAHFHRHRLLIELCDLRLTGIDNSGDTRRQHIVHRLATGILLDVHCRDCHIAFGWLVDARIGVIIVVTPFASQQFQRCETQVNRLLEIGEKHSYKTNGREIVYRPHCPLIVA